MVARLFNGNALFFCLPCSMGKFVTIKIAGSSYGVKELIKPTLQSEKLGDPKNSALDT